MSALAGVETAVGVLLIFFLPGYALTRAVFPEWRIRGDPDAGLRAVETATLSFVLSVALTVLLGYGLLVIAPGGFQAYWSSPVLEALLGAVTAGGLIVAYYRGAFSRTPPPAAVSPADAEETDTWELLSRLDQLGREERRLAHAIRRAPDASTLTQLNAELARVRSERQDLETRREALYAR